MGLTDKTRVLDAKQTGGPEIEALRALWAEMQNEALERQGHEVRVDHRSLAVQREAALAQGQALRAEELDRAAEVKPGPAASAIERREARAAELEGGTTRPSPSAARPCTRRGRSGRSWPSCACAWSWRAKLGPTPARTAPTG